MDRPPVKRIPAIAYLAFCYTVHYRVVPVTASGFIDTSPAHICQFFPFLHCHLVFKSFISCYKVRANLRFHLDYYSWTLATGGSHWKDQGM